MKVSHNQMLIFCFKPLCCNRYQSGGQVNGTLAGSGQIWLDEMFCSGTEATLPECPRNSWGSNDCSHGEDVAIICGKVKIIIKH